MQMLLTHHLSDLNRCYLVSYEVISRLPLITNPITLVTLLEISWWGVYVGVEGEELGEELTSTHHLLF